MNEMEAELRYGSRCARPSDHGANVYYERDGTGERYGQVVALSSVGYDLECSEWSEARL